MKKSDSTDLNRNYGTIIASKFMIPPQKATRHNRHSVGVEASIYKAVEDVPP